MVLGGYRGAGGTGNLSSWKSSIKQMSFKSGFESRERVTV